MDAQAQTQDLPQGSPHRLNVIPNAVCRECFHSAWLSGQYKCKAGAFTIDPVTGSKDYARICAEHNTDGECSDYLAKETRRPGTKKDADNIFIAILVVVVLTLIALLGVMRVDCRKEVGKVINEKAVISGDLAEANGRAQVLEKRLELLVEENESLRSYNTRLKAELNHWRRPGCP